MTLKTITPKYKTIGFFQAVVVLCAFLLFGSDVIAANVGYANPVESKAGVSIGDSFDGEELNYKVGFWIFNNIARARLVFQRRGDIYEATLRARTTGLLKFVRQREDRFIARMEAVDGGNRLRTLSFEKTTVLDGKERRKLVEMDYDKGVMRWKKWRNGKFSKSGEQPIPPGVIYDDPLAAFYNLRYGVYGSVADAAAFTIKTFPTKEGADIDITVRFASRKEFEKRIGSATGKEGYLADARLDKELFDSKSGDMEILFNPDMSVTHGVAKDVLFFGDVRGELILPVQAK